MEYISAQFPLEFSGFKHRSHTYTTQLAKSKHNIFLIQEVIYFQNEQVYFFDIGIPLQKLQGISSLLFYQRNVTFVNCDKGQTYSVKIYFLYSCQNIMVSNLNDLKSINIALNTLHCYIVG